jgi:glutathione S-transferase
MPRPDLSALGVSYRRIPVMSIGKDIYCDTRLILQKLEALFPASAAYPSIAASSSDARTIERLLEFWAVDGGIFARAAQLIPTDSPMLQDPRFTKDREGMTGRSWDKTMVERMRPEALVEVQGAFKFLEETLLADGRVYVLKTDQPTLADIEGVFVSYTFLPSLANVILRG